MTAARQLILTSPWADRVVNCVHGYGIEARQAIKTVLRIGSVRVAPETRGARALRLDCARQDARKPEQPAALSGKMHFAIKHAWRSAHFHGKVGTLWEPVP